MEEPNKKNGIKFILLIPYLTTPHLKYLAQKTANVKKYFDLSEKACMAFRNEIRTYLSTENIKYKDKEKATKSLF